MVGSKVKASGNDPLPQRVWPVTPYPAYTRSPQFVIDAVGPAPNLFTDRSDPPGGTRSVVGGSRGCAREFSHCGVDAATLTKGINKC
jgi:hypothetical protein